MSGNSKDSLAAARLRRSLADEEKHRERAGRLIEHDDVSKAFERMGRLDIGRPASPRGVTFHFALTHVGASRDRNVSNLPSDRIWVFPNRREVDVVRRSGGRYDRMQQAWFVPSSGAAATIQYRTPEAQARWVRGGGPGVRGVAAAMDFQGYIERAELDEAERLRQVVHDAEGAVSFGNLGEDVVERRMFWKTYAEAAGRANARLQSRIIVEVPHELVAVADGPARIRRLAQAIVAPLAERSLPYHVVAHWPEVDKGTDSRNVHLHIVYGERTTERLGVHHWSIGKVDRSARGDEAGGAAWAAGLRDRYAAALNDSLAEIGARRRYDPRSYA